MSNEIFQTKTLSIKLRGERELIKLRGERELIKWRGENLIVVARTFDYS